MRRLHYTGDTILVSDDVSAVVLAYAAELAAAQTSDIVVVPVIGEAGEPATAEILLGPASQIYAVSAPGIADTSGDPALVADLHQRIARLHPTARLDDTQPPWDGGVTDI